jgi:hypothetical protein
MFEFCSRQVKDIRQLFLVLEWALDAPSYTLPAQSAGNSARSPDERSDIRDQPRGEPRISPALNPGYARYLSADCR